MQYGAKTVAAVCAAAMVCFACAGCAFRITASPEELYSLPRLPTEYTELDGYIKALLGDGAEYAAPVSGTNIQSVQLADLNGDGQKEAIAFLRKNTDEKPLKIYIFSEHGSSYEQSALIEGIGSAIYSVTYSDFNQDGWQELAVGWRISADQQVLTVYALQDGQPRELMRSNYVKYAVTDLDGTVPKELVVLRSDDEGGGVADCYDWNNGALELGGSAPLSVSMAELNAGHMTAGALSDGTPALFITGVSDSRVAVTDLLAARNGQLANLTLSDSTGVSTEIYRYRALFPTDINDDGITEVPVPVSLPALGEDVESGMYCIHWCSYDREGGRQVVETTYHANEDGWYLTLPETWDGKIFVSRAVIDADESAVTFSAWHSGGSVQELFRIYTITGENRTYKAARGNRFLLSRQSNTIYAAELLEGSRTWEEAVTEDGLCTRFHLITTEWTAGDN